MEARTRVLLVTHSSLFVQPWYSLCSLLKLDYNLPK